MSGRLSAQSPLDKISRGFGFITDEEERKIVSVDQTAPGRSFHVQLSDGKITGEVKAVEKQEAAGKI